MNVLIFFDDGKTFKTNIPEDTMLNQMRRPKSKRLYTCGIEFSRVDKAEVIVDVR